jgi:MFS family permease
LFAKDGPIRRNQSVQLLANANARNFYLGNLTNSTGMEMRVMAQSWLLLELGGSQLMLGAAMGLRFLPAIVIGLVAGVWIDKLGGRFVLLWERIMLLVLAVITALLVITDTVEIWHVIVLSVVSSTLMVIGGPAMNSMVTKLVPQSSLQAANSINQLTMSSSRALGPMAAGFLIAAYGMSSPWLALIGLYILSVGATWKMPRHDEVQSTGESTISAVKNGLIYVKSNPIISRIMILAFTVIFVGAMGPMVPIYAKEVFDVGGTGLGVMMAVNAVGYAFGALIVAMTGGFKRKSVSLIVAVLIYAGAQVGFGFSTSFSMALVFLFINGTAPPLWISSIVTLLQTESDSKMLGRVMALFALSVQNLFLGALIWSWLGVQIGNDWMLLWVAVAFVLSHTLVLVMSPAIRKL